jgi:hypothetical protein
VNPAGEPERDDTGLPPVDIDIPDDARELERDVQAYYREQRAQRRRARRLRIFGSLAKDGIMVPLLACCLILALITGTLLTVFTATSDQNPHGLSGVAKAAGAQRSRALQSSGSATSGSASRVPRSRPPAATPSAATPTVPSAAAPDVLQKVGALPAGTLMLSWQNRWNQPIQLQAVSGTMLVLIPNHCHCTAALRQLTQLSIAIGAPTYLVGTSGTIAEAEWLDARLDPAARARTDVALDAQSVLANVYPPHGLTAILVGRSYTDVQYVDHVSTSISQADLTSALIG